ncbi:dihydrofolate reductase family protein [Micromonospora sp. NPDC047465]|uniref:dihydrofolate reductase family protein n=1 Tax=Micromonospora sp. NPDC047465 TaxID=3154813 RepID=UPI0033D9B0E4
MSASKLVPSPRYTRQLSRRTVMGKLVVSMFTTLDGVIERPDRWAFQFASADSMEQGLRQLHDAEALLLGRVTYEGFAASWPNMTDEAGYADKMNTMPKYVVSTTLDEPTWNNTTVIADDPAARIGKVKTDLNGDLLVFGSNALVTRLLPHGLIDEIRLVTYPVVIGDGTRLFADGDGMASFRLLDTTTFQSGVVVLTYAPVNEQDAAAASA